MSHFSTSITARPGLDDKEIEAKASQEASITMLKALGPNYKA